LERARAEEVVIHPERYPSSEDHARALEAALAGEAEPTPDASEVPLADELSVDRVARLFEREPVTIRRWRSGINLPRDWKRRPLWGAYVDPASGETVEPWHVYNLKDQRLRVAAINTEFLDDMARDLLTVLRRDQYMVEGTVLGEGAARAS
jgi:hypothetical protein